MGGTGLRFGVLGPLLVSVDGTPVELGARKQRAVLAKFVLKRNLPVSIESLTDALWDQSPPTMARQTVQAYVSNLRRLFSDAGFDPKGLLAKAQPGYRLNVAEADCDLGRFDSERIAGVHAAAAGRFEEASSHLSAALAEWRGPFLEDLREFAFVEREAIAQSKDKVRAHTALVEAEIACGRAYSVIPELERLAAENPLDEELWLQLATAYYVVERQSDALGAYAQLKTNLAEELGIDPGPTAKALYQKILDQEPLDTKRAAQAAAAETFIHSKGRGAAATRFMIARLRDTAGRHYPLEAGDIRIGRLPDNDIVLSDADVSRHHAVVVDTGTSFRIMDLGSANGVKVQDERIDIDADLADGDRIRIGGHEFTFEIHSR
jgi:DNA-binding SARP family transcriptional activator